MRWANVMAAKLVGLFQKTRRERELSAEVRVHLEMQIEDNLAAGMSAADARKAALRSFGAIEPMKECYRDRRGYAFVDALAQDVRYTLRTLRKSPGFAVTSIGVLAIAIGANTAMFSVLHAVLLRPLPYRSPEQLALVWTEMPSQSLREGRSAYQNVEEWRRQSQTFSELAVWDPASVTLTNAGESVQISVNRISPNLLPMLGVEPILGRTFSAGDAEGQQRVALLSHRFWQTRFGGSPDAIGASIELDGKRSRIIGVLPSGVDVAPLGSDLFEPYTLVPDWEVVRRSRGAGSWFVAGRLRPTATFDAAQAEMSTIARRLDDQSTDLGVSVVPMSLQITGTRPRLALWMLMGAVLCVLLIAATNVASLSLARSASREREISVRAALGADRRRIIQQLLTESLTLTICSGLVGLLVALGGIRVILAVRPGNLPRLDEVALDPTVLGWTLTLCVLTGVLVGLTPALAMAGRHLIQSAQQGGRSVSAGLAARRIRRGLVVVEFALAIMLLVGAGLLVRSLWSAQHVDPGFSTARVLMVQLAIPDSRTTDARVDLYRRVLDQVQSLPNVERGGIIGDLFVGGSPEQIVTVEGDVRPRSDRLRFRRDEVSPELFATLGIPLLRGRFFSAEDGPSAPRVAIVNDAMARRLWPGRDAVGQRFTLGGPDSASPLFTVVGIVGDMRRQGLEAEPSPQMFEPLAQNPSRMATLLVRTSTENPLALVGPLQAAVHRVDARMSFYGGRTLDNRLDSFLTERRFETSVLIGFSAVALLMAAIGIYGLIQYSVAIRTHEIAIRMAVGAQAEEIFRMTISEGLTLGAIGLAVGLVGAVWLARTGSSLLFGVTATDPLTFATVSLLLTVVAAAASYFPARRAMKVEPIVALRQG